MAVWTVHGRRAFYVGWAARVMSFGHWARKVKVRRGHRIQPLPRSKRVDGSVWAVAMVKNEADIIEGFVAHVLSQEIDRLLIVDNGSTDGTREIIRRLAVDRRLVVGDDTEVGYYQADKMTRLAHLARRAGADWVIPMDADEFWFAEAGTVADFLSQCDGDLIAAPIHNAFPTEEAPCLRGLGSLVRVDLDPGPHGKAAARVRRGMWIGMGNHRIERPGVAVTGLFVLHLPWRSFEQFKRKVHQGAAALDAAGIKGGLGVHWRANAQLSDAEIAHRWQRLLQGQGDSSMDWTPGSHTEIMSGLGTWRDWRLGTPEEQVPDEDRGPGNGC